MLIYIFFFMGLIFVIRVIVIVVVVFLFVIREFICFGDVVSIVFLLFVMNLDLVVFVDI